MKYLFTFFFAMILTISSAQKSKIIGSWLLSKVEVANNVQNPYQITNFKENGSFWIMGIEFGTWNYNKSNNSIVMKSDLEKDFNGEGKIVNLTKKEMILTKGDVKMYYNKVTDEAININNKDSGLLGQWIFKDVPNPNISTFVTFTEPDNYTIVEKDGNSTSTFKGTWIFNPKEKSLILIGLNGENPFKGKNNQVKINKNTLELENNGAIFKGVKNLKSNQKIEHLSFSEDDFYNENGDYKYEDDVNKLPWRNWGELKTSLLNTKQLVYKYSIFNKQTKTFETKILTANVQASLEEEGFEIDYIFNGYDSYHLPEDTALPLNKNFTDPLYPLKGDTFRVVGNEQVTTPAGNFDCTVVETVTNMGFLKKLWMINNKLGVYAKIIEEDPDQTFGHYYIYELQEIK